LERVLSLSFVLCFLSALAGGGETISVTAGGDVMLGRYHDGAFREVGGLDPFAGIAVHLSASDLAFVNLETPLMAGHPVRRPSAPRGLVFRGEAIRAQQMRAAGIDVVSLANNHAEDLRLAGVRTTVDILAAAGLVAFGALPEGDPFAPVLVQVEDKTVVFLGTTTRRNIGEPRKDQWIPSAYRQWKWLVKELPERVAESRARWPNALILVSMHWGEEYVREAPVAHQRLARSLIDSGANGVFGHHPHVLQPVEVYQGAPILYSMGNLVFDQRSLSRRQSALFTMSWTPDAQRGWRLEELEILPLMLRGRDTGPTLASPEEALPILERMERGAARQNTVLERKEGRLIWTRIASTAD
jgi:poly-gamma-glutamate synthesis protein (capsule biosynthesis protein)